MEVKLYEVGQRVYTAKEIVGWFDYSMQRSIPTGTLGTIMRIEYNPGEDVFAYVVDFEKEFGLVRVPHDSLKVG